MTSQSRVLNFRHRQRCGADTLSSEYQRVAIEISGDPRSAYVVAAPFRKPVMDAWQALAFGSGKRSLGDSPVKCGVKFSAEDPMPARAYLTPNCTKDPHIAPLVAKAEAVMGMPARRKDGVFLLRTFTEAPSDPSLTNCPSDWLRVPKTRFLGYMRAMAESADHAVVQDWLDGLLLSRAIGLDDQHFFVLTYNHWLKSPERPVLDYKLLQEASPCWRIEGDDGRSRFFNRLCGVLTRRGLLIEVVGGGEVLTFPLFDAVARWLATEGQDVQGDSIGELAGDEEWLYVPRSSLIRTLHVPSDRSDVTFPTLLSIGASAPLNGSKVLALKASLDAETPGEVLPDDAAARRKCLHTVAHVAEIEQDARSAAFMAGWREAWALTYPEAELDKDLGTWLGPQRHGKSTLMANKLAPKLLADRPEITVPQAYAAGKAAVQDWDRVSRLARTEQTDRIAGQVGKRLRLVGEAAKEQAAKFIGGPDLPNLPWIAKKVAGVFWNVVGVSDATEYPTSSFGRLLQHAREAVSVFKAAMTPEVNLAMTLPQGAHPGARETGVLALETLTMSMRETPEKAKLVRFPPRAAPSRSFDKPAATDSVTELLVCWRAELDRRALADPTAYSRAASTWAADAVEGLAVQWKPAAYREVVRFAMDNWSDFVAEVARVDRGGEVDDFLLHGVRLSLLSKHVPRLFSVWHEKHKSPPDDEHYLRLAREAKARSMLRRDAEKAAREAEAEKMNRKRILAELEDESYD